MPSEEESIKYLWVALTAGGPPTIDMDAMATDLNIKKGAAAKRWSRLKKAMDDGKPPGAMAHQYLWLAVMNSNQAKSMNWNIIAKACNTTPGAVSKRWSRLKQPMAAGAAVPKGGDGSREAARTLKRKHVTGNPESKAADANANFSGAGANGDGGEASDHDRDIDIKALISKRKKTSAPKEKARPKLRTTKAKTAKPTIASVKDEVIEGADKDSIVVHQDYRLDEVDNKDMRVSHWLEGI